MMLNEIYIKAYILQIIKKHRYKNEMCASLYAEGWDEWYRCSLCGKTKRKYMNKVYEEDLETIKIDKLKDSDD